MDMSIEAIRKRNKDLRWMLDGNGVWCRLHGAEQTDRVFRQKADDIDALLKIIDENPPAKPMFFGPCSCRELQYMAGKIQTATAIHSRAECTPQPGRPLTEPLVGSSIPSGPIIGGIEIKGDAVDATRSIHEGVAAMSRKLLDAIAEAKETLIRQFLVASGCRAHTDAIVHLVGYNDRHSVDRYVCRQDNRMLTLTTDIRMVDEKLVANVTPTVGIYFPACGGFDAIAPPRA